MLYKRFSLIADTFPVTQSDANQDRKRLLQHPRLFTIVRSRSGRSHSSVSNRCVTELPSERQSQQGWAQHALTHLLPSPIAPEWQSGLTWRSRATPVPSSPGQLPSEGQRGIAAPCFERSIFRLHLHRECCERLRAPAPTTLVAAFDPIADLRFLWRHVAL